MNAHYNTSLHLFTACEVPFNAVSQKHTQTSVTVESQCNASCLAASSETFH